MTQSARRRKAPVHGIQVDQRQTPFGRSYLLRDQVGSQRCVLVDFLVVSQR
jgi:hypothetical protein